MISEGQMALAVLPPVLEFKGEHRFLSNFSVDGDWVCPRGPWWMHEVETAFPSVEHAYQAAKVEPGTPHAVEHYRAIARAAQPGGEERPDPSRAKVLGSARGFAGAEATLRAGWEEIKVQVMLACLRAKFGPTGGETDLSRKLIATSPRALVEGNTWGDTYWGVCRGEGKNMLGKCLMLVRSELVVAASAGLRPVELRPYG